jgi:hypothetical protein
VDIFSWRLWLAGTVLLLVLVVVAVPKEMWTKEEYQAMSAEGTLLGLHRAQAELGDAVPGDMWGEVRNGYRFALRPVGEGYTITDTKRKSQRSRGGPRQLE